MVSLFICQVMRPGLNVQLAPEAVAQQLNVRSGALVLSVRSLYKKLPFVNTGWIAVHSESWLNFFFFDGWSL